MATTTAQKNWSIVNAEDVYTVTFEDSTTIEIAEADFLIEWPEAYLNGRESPLIKITDTSDNSVTWLIYHRCTSPICSHFFHPSQFVEHVKNLATHHADLGVKDFTKN